MTPVALCVALLLQVALSAIIKSSILSPSRPSVDGATASCINNDWVISDADWIDFHLQINLDPSWGFHPTKPSVISVTFHTTTSLPFSDLDPRFVFTIYNGPHLVFGHNALPTCDTSNILLTPHVSNPTTVTMTNHPTTHDSWITISSTGYTQTCTYRHAFAPDFALQIYISVDAYKPHEMTQFTQCDITYEYATHAVPTTHPTLQPTTYALPHNDSHRIISIITADSQDGVVGINEVVILLAIVLILCCICGCVFCVVYKLRTSESTPVRVLSNPQSEVRVAEISPVPQPHVLVENTQMTQQNDMERAILASWLENDVALPQYYPLFIANGFDSVTLVAALQNKSQLRQMGIHILGHQTLLWGEIKKLKKKPKTSFTPGPGTGAFRTDTELQCEDSTQSDAANMKPREPGGRYKFTESEWEMQRDLPPSMSKKKSSMWDADGKDLPPSQSKQKSVFARALGVFKDEAEPESESTHDPEGPHFNTKGFIQ